MENGINDNSEIKRHEIYAERELNKLKRRSTADHAKILELNPKFNFNSITKINKLYEQIEEELEKALETKDKAIKEEQIESLVVAANDVKCAEEKNKLEYVKKYLLLIANLKGYVTLEDIQNISYNGSYTSELVDYLTNEKVKIRGLNDNK